MLFKCFEVSLKSGLQILETLERHSIVADEHDDLEENECN